MKGFRYFAMKVSGLALISFMRLNSMKDIPPVKSAWYLFHPENKAHVLLSLEGKNKEGKTITQN